MASARGPTQFISPPTSPSTTPRTHAARKSKSTTTAHAPLFFPVAPAAAPVTRKIPSDAARYSSFFVGESTSTSNRRDAARLVDVLLGRRAFTKKSDRQRSLLLSASASVSTKMNVGPSSAGRALTIQSHVVSGYVGNKCAVFPLQLHGFDVDPILSVQFSNHTGYGSWKGEVMTGDQLWSLVEGLETNGLLEGYTHLLTGYIGSASMLRTVARLVRKLRAHNPNLVYVCDPVLGDNGKMYVPAELATIYRDGEGFLGVGVRCFIQCLLYVDQDLRARASLRM